MSKYRTEININRQKNFDLLDYPESQLFKRIQVPGRDSEIQVFEDNGIAILTIRNNDLTINYTDLGKVGVNFDDIIFLQSLLPSDVQITGIRFQSLALGQKLYGIQVFTSRRIRPNEVNQYDSKIPEGKIIKISETVGLHIFPDKKIARLSLINSSRSRIKAFSRFMLGAYIDTVAPKGEIITNQEFNNAEKQLLKMGYVVTGSSVLRGHPSSKRFTSPTEVILFIKPKEK